MYIQVFLSYYHIIIVIKWHIFLLWHCRIHSIETHAFNGHCQNKEQVNDNKFWKLCRCWIIHYYGYCKMSMYPLWNMPVMCFVIMLIILGNTCSSKNKNKNKKTTFSTKLHEMSKCSLFLMFKTSISIISSNIVSLYHITLHKLLYLGDNCIVI